MNLKNASLKSFVYRLKNDYLILENQQNCNKELLDNHIKKQKNKL